MKKWCCMFLLISLLVSQFQIGVLYADSVVSLSETKQENIEKLEVIEEVIDTTIEKIDKKINNTEIEARLEEKEAEVEEYLQEVKQEISSESSERDIKKKVKEAQKVVVLKVVSGVTQYEDVVDNISTDVADTPDEIEQATETLQDSLETKSGDYSIIIKTKHDFQKTLKLFHTFDTGIVLETLYDIDGVNYFEVGISEDSLFRQEMFEDIEKGILPETYLGIDIVLPEVFGIESDIDLSGEDLSQTWGIEQYRTYEYFSNLDLEENTPVTVGVVDTGIDYRHPDLSDRVIDGYDFVNDDADALDDQGHGTHVAGTIGASINAGGIIGVNPYVQMSPLKICNARGFCPSYAVLRALDYATEHNIDILNMSLGGRANPRGHAICEGIQAYRQSGGIVVSAAGNSNIDTSQFVPGGCEDVISVSAIDETGNKASFSNYGNAVDIAAPGVGVYSTYPIDKGNYRKLSGTSMSTPHVVGLVSLLRSDDPSRNQDQILELLREHPLSVNSRAPIAHGVNTATLFDSLQDTIQIANDTPVEQDQIQDETEVEDTPAEYSEDREPEELPTQEDFSAEGVFGDDAGEEKDVSRVGIASVNSDIVFVPDTGDENISQAEGVGLSSVAELPENQTLYIGEKPEDIQINASDVLVDISERLIDIETPDFYSVPDTIIFDTEGYKERGTDSVEINSLGESEFQEIEVSLETTTDVLEHQNYVNQLPETQESSTQGSGVVINNFDDLTLVPEVVETIDTPDQVKENIEENQKIIGLPELEDSIEINSTQEPVFTPVDIKTYEDFLPKQGPENPSEELLEIESVEDNGQESAGQEEVIVETLYELDQEVDASPVYIDDTGIEINSLADTDSELSQQEQQDWFAAIDAIEDGTLPPQTEIPEDVQIPESEEGVSINFVNSMLVYIGEQTELETFGTPHQINFDKDIVQLITLNGKTYIQGISPGVARVSLYSSSWNHVNTISVSVEAGSPRSVDISIGQEYYTISNDNRRLLQEIQDTSVVTDSPNNTSKELKVQAVGEGVTQVRTYYRGYFKDIYEFHVRPAIKRTVTAGESFVIDLGNATGYSYSISDPQIVSATLSGDVIEIVGQRAGASTIHIKKGSKIIEVIEATILPPIETRTVEIGKTTSFTFPNNTYSQKGVSTGGKVYLSKTSNSAGSNILSVMGIGVGTTDIYIHEGTDHVKTLRITVRDASSRTKIAKGHILSRSYGDHRISFYTPQTHIGQVFTENDTRLYTAAKAVGKFEVIQKNIYGGVSSVHLYEVVDTQIPSTKKTVLYGDVLLKSSYPDYDSITDGDILRLDGTKIRAESQGNAQIIEKKFGYISRVTDVSVTLPTVELQEVSIYQYITGDPVRDISFSNADQYTYVSDNSDGLTISVSSDDIRIRGSKAGVFPVGIYYKDQYVTTLTVNVQSYLKTSTHSIDINDRDRNSGRGFQFPLSGASSYSVSVSEPGIVSVLLGSQDLFFQPQKEGTTQIYIKKGGHHLYTVNFSVVVPDPDPKIIPKILKTCETQEDGHCEVYLGEDFGLSFTTTQQDIITVRTTPNYLDGILVYGDKPGTTSLYIYRHGQHAYTLDVLVAEKQKPVERYLYCTIEVGGGCSIYLENALEYNYQVTNRGLIDTKLSPHDISIYGKAVGASKIYIYNTSSETVNGTPQTKNTYFYTIVIDTVERSDPLQVDSSRIKLYEGQTYDLQVQSGNSPYEMQSDDSEIISWQMQGNLLRIRGLQAGSAGMTMTDASGRKLILDIQVTRDLELDERQLTIEQGQSGYLHIVKGNGRYGFEKNNSKVNVYRTNNEVYEVRALELGESIIKITDSEGNATSAKITIVAPGGGNSNAENNSQTGIRYIRDWLSGSNRNGGNHWVEIQALDTSGNNLAESKNVESDYGGYEPRPLSRITDGNTISGAYASGGTGLKYVKIDLGEILDIDQVRVWHYYYDGYTTTKTGRIYNGTKTEVSQDGETWYTLFDSAIEGTYTEPQDGTGKTHQIPAHLFANTDDTDTYNTLIKNGQFNGFGERLTGGASWLGSKDNGWRTYNKNEATAAIKDGRLHLNNPGGASYVEVRNTDRGYFGIADTSIKIKPNTTYRIEYDYETKYISGTQQHGFKLGVLTSDTSGNKAESFDTIPYVNTTKPLTHVTHEFRTPSNAHYANISPVIYGHWGDKNLNMQAWVDNLTLIEVLGKPDTPVPNGVRYIRDSINGASNSTSNVWNEIQAIERNTGINRAKNIIPTTDITNVSGTLSRLTDGNTGNNWTGRYGGSGLSYMQLDLGAIYDISQIQVWHYNDGRIYKDTKTEVSPDGINWTTLHDAAIHGTYNEPRDGSGRSYGVRSVEDTSEDDEALREFEAFLEELFGEVEGVKVSYHPGCVPVDSEECLQYAIEESEATRQIKLIAYYETRIADVIDRYFRERGADFMKALNSGLLERRSNNEFLGNKIIIADLMILRIRMNLGNSAYLRGVHDSLTINNLFDIAVGVGAGFGATKIVEKLIKEYPDKFATKLGSKAIPVVGWGLTAFMVGYTGYHTAEYTAACYGTKIIEGQLPEYYCGKLTVNGILLFAGVGASKSNIPGAFSAKTRILSNFSGEQKEFVTDRISKMSPEILEKNLKDPDKFIKDFQDGRYPKLLGSSSGGKKYVTQKSNDGYLLNSKGEYISHTNEKPIDFIIQNGEIKFGSSHSFISDKKNVDYAGEIRTDSLGKILSINNNSGHYKPTLEGLEGAMDLLEEQVGDVRHLFTPVN